MSDQELPPEDEAAEELPPEEALAGDADGAADAVADEPSVPVEPSVPAEPDYQDLYLRAAAETENIRKRARRDIDAAHTRGVARLARELLPSLDNLDRAIAAAESEEESAEHHLTQGIRLVQQELLAALTRVGIEAFSPEGEQFDPHQHEAVAQVAADGAETGTITGVFQSGYRYKDEVLRAAKVTVAP